MGNVRGRYGHLTMFFARTVGNLTMGFARTVENLTVFFFKSQIPGGSPGGGTIAVGIDSYITA